MEPLNRFGHAARASVLRSVPVSGGRRLEAQFLKPPPRTVSPVLLASTLFGGMLQLGGWVFFGFGMIFFWIFAANSEGFVLPQLGGTATTRGVVTGYESTNASEGDSPIYATRYRYEVDGMTYAGTAYATGHHLDAGDEVSLTYAPGKPAWSQVDGMRRRMFGAGAMLVVVFPLAGLALLLAGLRGRVRAMRLLRTGMPAFGKLVDKTPTNVTVNKQPVYRLSFEFKARDGRTGIAEARSHMPASVEDQAEEALLYDPADLERAVLLDDLPGRAVITPDGALHCGSLPRALASLIVPALVVGGHGFYVYAAYLA